MFLLRNMANYSKLSLLPVLSAALINLCNRDLSDPKPPEACSYVLSLTLSGSFCYSSSSFEKVGHSRGISFKTDRSVRLEINHRNSS